MKTNDITQALDSALKDTGRSLKVSTAEFAQHVTERGAYLASVAGQVGFDLAMRAEEEGCRIVGGVKAVHEADGVDGKILGIVSLSLRVLAGGAA